MVGSDFDFDYLNNKFTPVTPRETNLALTPTKDGKVIIHRADCPVVRALANAGEPVITLFGVQRKLELDIERHSCLLDISISSSAHTARNG